MDPVNTELPLKPVKMILKVILELLLDVPEVLLEVLDLSRRSWRRFWGSAELYAWGSLDFPGCPVEIPIHASVL